MRRLFERDYLIGQIERTGKLLSAIYLAVIGANTVVLIRPMTGLAVFAASLIGLAIAHRLRYRRRKLMRILEAMYG